MRRQIPFTLACWPEDCSWIEDGKPVTRDSYQLSRESVDTKRFGRKIEILTRNYGMYGTVKSIRTASESSKHNCEKLITLARKSLNPISKLRRLGRT